MHLYRDGQPYTLLVFGPYADGTEWDIEIHRDHVTFENKGTDTYVSTHTLPRRTHLVADLWNEIHEHSA